MRIRAAAQWPPRTPPLIGFLPRVWLSSALTALALALVIRSVPAGLQPLAYGGFLIPAAYIALQVMRSRALRFHAEQRRGTLREGATPLPGAGAILTLSPDLRELQCHLPDGQYARQARDMVTQIHLVPPHAPGILWQLRIENASGPDLLISFARPADAEGWYWRLLHAWPEWGLDHALKSAVDVVLPVGSQIPLESLPGWISGDTRIVAQEGSPVVKSVSPPFAEALVETPGLNGLKPEIVPTGIKFLAPLATVQPSMLSRQHAVSRPLWLVTSRQAQRAGFAMLSLLLVCTLLAMREGGQTDGIVVTLAIVLTTLTESAWREKKFTLEGFDKFDPAQSLKPQEGFVRDSFILIQANDALLRYGTSEGMDGAIPIAEIRGLHLKAGFQGTGLAIEQKGETITMITPTPRDAERLLIQCTLDLVRHPHAPALKWPTLVTVILKDDDLAPAARLRLREDWVHLEHFPVGLPLPCGPLVGPVSAAFGLALERFLLRNAVNARVMPYDPDDPAPLSRPPGGPEAVQLAEWLASGEKAP